MTLFKEKALDRDNFCAMMSSETHLLKTPGVCNNPSVTNHTVIVFLSLSWGFFLSMIGFICLVGVYRTPDCVKHAGGYLPRTTLALPWEKAAECIWRPSHPASQILEKAFGLLALFLYSASVKPFQEPFRNGVFWQM